MTTREIEEEGWTVVRIVYCRSTWVVLELLKEGNTIGVQVYDDEFQALENKMELMHEFAMEIESKL